MGGSRPQAGTAIEAADNIRIEIGKLLLVDVVVRSYDDINIILNMTCHQSRVHHLWNLTIIKEN